MFVDANLLLQGLKPYKEIFIYYGVLSNILHALAIIILGNNILSIWIVTSIFYSLSFLIFYLILRNFKISHVKSSFAILIIFLIHPSIVLPWSDYFAFFFVLLGILYFSGHNTKKYIFTGFFWSLAYLCRQTYFAPLLLSILFIIFSENYFSNSEKKKKFFNSNYFFLLVTFLLPIITLLIYLKINNTFIYWKFATFDMVDIFLPVNNHSYDKILSFFSFIYQLLRPFLSNLFYSIKNLDPRWFFYLIIFITNIFILSIFFIRRVNKKISQISFLSLGLCVNSLHLAEIFRLSTSLVIGFIPLIFFFRKIKYFNYFYFIFFILLISTWHGGKHNYSYDYYYKKKDNYFFSNISYFKFQKMPKNYADFYDRFNTCIREINELYVINSNYNLTSIPILAFMSSSKSYQVGTFYMEKWKNIYLAREKLDLNENYFSQGNDLIIFYPSNDGTYDKKFSKNFFVYKKIDYPFGIYKHLLILLPNNVVKNIINNDN